MNRITKKDFQLVRFPNGEFKLILDKHIQDNQDIEWKYNDEFENGDKLNTPSEHLVALMQLNGIIGTMFPAYRAKVYVDYVPFRRQDKRKLLGEIKFNNWTQEALYRINLVETIPHDEVSDIDIRKTNTNVFKRFIDEDTDIIVFPDTGATKRYDAHKFNKQLLAFSKTRDAVTGQLTFDELNQKQKAAVDGKKCTIVDDIIAYGGTFKHVAGALKEAGATEVHLVVNHSDGVYEEKDLKKAGIDKITVMNAVVERDELVDSKKSPWFLTASKAKEMLEGSDGEFI